MVVMIWEDFRSGFGAHEFALDYLVKSSYASLQTPTSCDSTVADIPNSVDHHLRTRQTLGLAKLVVPGQ